MARRARLVVPLLCAVALAGCSHGRQPTRAERRQRRNDLILVAKALTKLERPLGRELAFARAAWLLIDTGLVRHGRKGPQLVRSRRLAAHLAAAEAAAVALPTELVPEAQQLTGPAATVAGIYHQAQVVLDHSWEVLLRSQQPAPKPAAAYLLGNVNLYVAAIYDAYFNLSYIGRTVRGAYRRLGGRARFGSRFPMRDLDELVFFYSPRLRLRPHPWKALIEG